MVWLVIFVALLIPLTAVVLDSPVVRAFVDRGRGGDGSVPPDVKQLAERIGILETELEEARGEIRRLTDEQSFVRGLLEHPEKRQAEPAKLPRPHDD